MKKLLSVFLACMLVFTQVNGINAKKKGKINKIRLNVTKITIRAKKSFTLKLTGTKKSAKVINSKKKIVTVKQKYKTVRKKKKKKKVKLLNQFVVKGKKAGKAKVTLKVGKKKYTCSVKVLKPANKYNQSYSQNKKPQKSSTKSAASNTAKQPAKFNPDSSGKNQNSDDNENQGNIPSQNPSQTVQSEKNEQKQNTVNTPSSSSQNQSQTVQPEKNEQNQSAEKTPSFIAQNQIEKNEQKQNTENTPSTVSQNQTQTNPSADQPEKNDQSQSNTNQEPENTLADQTNMSATDATNSQNTSSSTDSQQQTSSDETNTSSNEDVTKPQVFGEITPEKTVTEGDYAYIFMLRHTGDVTWSTDQPDLIEIESSSTNDCCYFIAKKAGSAKIIGTIADTPFVCNVTIKKSYSYELTPVLAPFNEYYFLKTDDPTPANIKLVDDASIYNTEGAKDAYLSVLSYTFSDVKYEDQSIGRVKGGYIFNTAKYAEPTDGGTYTLWRKNEDSSEYHETTIKVNTTATVDNVDYLVNKYSDPSKGVSTDLIDIVQVLGSLSIYPRYLRDYTKKNPAMPYPALAASPYPELYLNEHYTESFARMNGLLLEEAYPYIEDSLGYPYLIATIAKKLDPNVKITYGGLSNHSSVGVTVDGQDLVFSGMGSGGPNPIYIQYVDHFYTFDQSDDDLFKVTDLDQLYNILMKYANDSDQYTNNTLTKSLSIEHQKELMPNGGWIRVGIEGSSQSAYSYNSGGYDYKEANYVYHVKNCFVDGRYVNINCCFVKGVSFDQVMNDEYLTEKPTVILTNQTYNDDGYIYTGDLEFEQNRQDHKWYALDVRTGAHYGNYDDGTYKELVYTTEELKSMNIDGNKDKDPESGFIFDGSAEPGTPFTN